MTYREATGVGIQEAFDKFHAANPHIYVLMLQIIRELRARGFDHFSIETVWERMRWVVYFDVNKTEGADIFKLNDAFASRYARLVNQEPDLVAFFRTRRLRAA